MKNPSPKKPTAKKGVPSLPYQEPHLGASARGKLLEEAIGREVRGFREKLGITISELAKAADMSAGMLSKIENGATSPSLSSLQALSKALQVPVTSLFRGFEEIRDASFVKAGQGLTIERRGTRAGHQYRRRRHAVFAANRMTTPSLQAHQPHYQSTDYNPLHGGIARWFEPMMEASASSASMRTILASCQALFGGLAPSTERWHIEVHQFRIEARSGEQGRPTPEGLHRDGVDYVLVLLIDRSNIASGTTTVHALDGQALGHFTLQHPFDAALVDDSRVAHGVTPVDAIDPVAPAFRDVLVITFIDERHRLRA